MQAVGEWVITRAVAPADEKGSLIIVPEGMERKEDASFAQVVSVDADNDMYLKEGDIVLMLLGSCLQMPAIDGEEYLASRIDRIICIVETAEESEEKTDK